MTTREQGRRRRKGHNGIKWNQTQQRFRGGSSKGLSSGRLFQDCPRPLQRNSSFSISSPSGARKSMKSNFLVPASIHSLLCDYVTATRC